MRPRGGSGRAAAATGPRSGYTGAGPPAGTGGGGACGGKCSPSAIGDCRPGGTRIPGDAAAAEASTSTPTVPQKSEVVSVQFSVTDPPAAMSDWTEHPQPNE